MSEPSKTVIAMVKGSAEGPGLCLLVVEDDDADAYLIFRALADHPAIGKIVHAPDGVEALKMVDDGEVKPDLAFIDLHMPRKNGFNLLTAFAGRAECSFPMVVLTSSTAPNDAIRSRLRSAIRVVTKPDSVEQLETVLSETIAAVCPGAAGATRDRARPRDLPVFAGVSASGADEFDFGAPSPSLS